MIIIACNEFINVSSRLHRCLIVVSLTKRPVFFNNNNNESIMLPICSRLGYVSPFWWFNVNFYCEISCDLCGLRPHKLCWRQLCGILVWSTEPLLRVAERFISSLMLEFVIEGFSVMTIYHVNEYFHNSNSFIVLKLSINIELRILLFSNSSKYASVCQPRFPTSNLPGCLVGISKNSTMVLQDYGRFFRKSRRQKCRNQEKFNSGSNHSPLVP